MMKCLTILLLLAMAACQGPLDNQPLCIDNTSCSIPAGLTSDDVCCGYLTYNHNAVPMQTVPQCLLVAQIPAYYNEYTSMDNMDTIFVGCAESTVEFGFQQYEWAFGGPYGTGNSASHAAMIVFGL